MAEDITDPEQASTHPRPQRSRYRSVQYSEDAEGRKPGNYETFPVSAPGAPRPEIHPVGKKRDPKASEGSDLTLGQAIRSLSFEDLKNLPLQPCARDAFLAGITSGFFVGGARAMLGGKDYHLPYVSICPRWIIITNIFWMAT